MRKQLSDSKKIKFYKKYPPLHKQVIVHGTRHDGTRFRIGCDWAIADLIMTLNVNNIRTLWSCQGNALGDHVAYVVINPSKLPKYRLTMADRIIRKYWEDKHVNMLLLDGNIAYYAYTKAQLKNTDKKYLARCWKLDHKEMDWNSDNIKMKK